MILHLISRASHHQAAHTKLASLVADAEGEHETIPPTEDNNEQQTTAMTTDTENDTNLQAM